MSSAGDELPQHEDASESFSGRESGPLPVSRLEPSRALHRILSAIAEGPFSEDSAAELLALLSNELGTSGCHVVVLEADAETGAERLLPLASAGQYGALLRDMPPIELDSPLEAAQVFRSRKPHFVDALHMPGADKAEGTGRWRSMISTQSFAVLPLLLRGDVLGVLTMQWSTPVKFDESFREALESIATASALSLAVDRSQAAGLQEPEGYPYARNCLESVMVTALGAPRDEGGTDPETVLCATTDVCGTGQLVFAHAEPEGLPTRLLLLAPGTLGAEMPEVAQSLAEAAVGLSGSPKVWLETLNRSLPKGGAGVSAWAAAFDPKSGALIEASAGVISTIVANSLGTEQQNEFKQLPLGLWNEETYAERPRMLLPGDLLEACIEDGPDLTLQYLTRAPRR